VSLLNDMEMIRSRDPQNMYNRIFDMPEHMEEALRMATAYKLDTSDFADIRNVVVIGMGGSAIGGDLARSYLSSELLIPFEVCRHYVLPEYVDDETLVIASSYSGNTEETLAALDDAVGRKAMIVAITTGGLMQEVAQFNQIPISLLPSGLPPRAALGYSFVSLLMTMERIGLAKNISQEIQAAIKHMRADRELYIEDKPVEENPAKKLATDLQGRIVLIYSGPTLTDIVGVRIKGQICENAKTLAFANQLPEMNHNELVGWSDQMAPFADKLAVVLLRDRDDHRQVLHRMNFVKEKISALGVPVHEIQSRGSGRLERLMSLVQMGDFISYYLAILNEVNPTPVAIIDELKQVLAARK